jgi:hypothetical protein
MLDRVAVTKPLDLHLHALTIGARLAVADG